MLMLIKQANWTFHALLIQSWKLICNSVNKFSFFGRFTVFLERILRLKRCENPDDYWYLVPLIFKSKITIFRKSEKSCRQRKFLQKEKVSKTAYLSHFWDILPWQGQKDLTPRHAVLERLISGIILYHPMSQSSKNAVTISNLRILQH